MEQQEQPNAVQLPMTPEATSAVVAVRYAVDADFRAAFDKDPKAALAQIGGEELPSDLEIVVHRNKDKCWNIALPAMETDGALGDQDIENVSGGVVGNMASTIALAVVAPAICAGVCTGMPGADSDALANAGGTDGSPGATGLSGTIAGLAAATVRAVQIGKGG